MDQPTSISQPTAALKYMTVPEKIELRSGERKTETTDVPNRYRPMKVPDKITLEASAAPTGSRDGGDGGGQWEDPGGRVAMETQRVGSGYHVSDYGGTHPPRAMDQRGFPQQQMQAPPPTVPPAQPPVPFSVELEARVRTLEQRVDRLTEAVVRTDSTGQKKGNGFWTVVTFAGWIMVPLIVVYLYHFRKGM